MVFENTGRGRVHVQAAEPPAERLLLFRRHFLVAEEDDDVLQEGVVDFLELLVADVAAEIDAEDLGTDCGCQRTHFDGLVGHTAPPGILFVVGGQRYRRVGAPVNATVNQDVE